ncbi:MAG: sigma-70 family RNA polymerase sigma factor [Telluria sp.]
MSDDAFDTYAGRGKLFALAYRMLGSAGDAEDIVQEAFVRWHTEPRKDIRNPQAFLTTVVTRLCLDHIKSARVRLETYPGVWLPEPLDEGEFEDVPDPSQLTPEERVQRLEAVSLAFLAVVQALSPIERAVYLLREIFDYSHSEVAAMLGRTPEACRQALHRARQSLSPSQAGDAPTAAHRELLSTFISSVRKGDLDELCQLLSEDVEARADGGGYVTAATRPVIGRRAVSRLYAGYSRKLPPDLIVRIVDLNGWPTALLIVGDILLSALQVRIFGNQVCGIDNVMSPKKLQRLASSLGLKTKLEQ